LEEEGSKMSSAAAITIDINALNDLLDNQKKLDDVFNSIFDEDPFVDSTAVLNNSTFGGSQDFYSNDEDILFNNKNKQTGQTERSTVSFIMPIVLEIAVLYYGILYFA